MAVAGEPPPVTWARNACDLDLGQLIDEAREAFSGELAIPMTVTRPPVLTSLDGHGQRVTEPTQGAQIGLTMSAQLFRRIQDPEGYGNVFPMARALDDLRGWCRGRHLKASSGPWEDHAADVALGPALQRPLCARLAWYVIAWRATPAWAARQERLAIARAARLLTGALQHAFEQRREWAHAEDSGVPQVLGEMRRSRRDARARAEASVAPDAVCRYCGGRYDPASLVPCPGSPENRMDDVESTAFADAYPGATLLCSPSRMPFL